MSTAIPALRCEGCAYDLSGTAAEGTCPECGRRVADSMPDSRPATAWQRRASVRTWASSGWRTLRRPRHVAKEVRIDPRSSQRLLALNFLLAAAAYLGPALLAVSGAYGTFSFQTSPGTTTFVLDNTAVIGFLGAFLVPFVFYPAVLGMARQWYVRRTPPIRPEVVWTSVAYSSYGFVAGAVAWALLRLLWLAVDPGTTLESGTSASAILLRILVALPTFVFFGGLAYAGYIDWRIMRANRFANSWTPADPAKEPA